MKMKPLETGRFRARLAAGPADLAQAQALRHLCFRGIPGQDADALDARCHHLIVETRAEFGQIGAGQVVATCRMLPVAKAADLPHSYSARFYDLSPLACLPGPMIEIGRFCIAPGAHDPDILRLAWGALTAVVDQGGFGLMFGCTSFRGAHVALHRPALAGLAAYAAPPGLGPLRAAPEVTALPPPDTSRAALAKLPPLLRSYLAMGGWVSDHAVIDRDLDTLHVFTGVEVAKVPAGRARALRALVPRP